ncbi:MAG: hypothetical protein ACR2KJ_02325 [Jatrophihabitans sp.]
MLLIGVARALGLLALPFEKVSRARVEKFARRQSLPITADNGTPVICYLATTRRWRGCGLLVSVALTVGIPLVGLIFWDSDTSGNLSVNVLALFAGWFAGAVVAEWRVSVAAQLPGRRRAAVLEPRRLADYLLRPSRLVAVAAWVGLGFGELSALGGLAAGHSRGLPVALLWIGLTALIGAVLITVGRQVLLRPQRDAAPDLIAADDALRSRSLHVLAGSSIAIAGYLLAAFVHALTPYSTILADGVGSLLGMIGVVLAPVLGFIVATSAVAPIRRAHRPLVADSAR